MCDSARHEGRESLLAEVFRRYGPLYLLRHRVTREQRLAILNIARCRTPAMGGHYRKCGFDDCDYTGIHYNSCRDRNCPRCAWVKREIWTLKQKARQLPVPTFLWTFTLPSQLNRIARQNPKRFYKLFFQAQHRALQEIATSMKMGKLGVASILHTWSKKLASHNHIHSQVTAGGFDGEKWNPAGPRFHMPLRRVRALYRKYLLQGLHELYETKQLVLRKDLKRLKDPLAFSELMTTLWSTRFIVHVRPPQGKPENALKYLSRYTRGTAISDYRMISLDQGQVTFRARGKETVTLGWEAFIGRFLMHVLPSGFKKVRYYGLYANSSGVQRELARQAIITSQPELATTEEDPKLAVLKAKTWAEQINILTGVDPLVCPKCHRRGIIITEFGPIRPDTS